MLSFSRLSARRVVTSSLARQSSRMISPLAGDSLRYMSTSSQEEKLSTEAQEVMEFPTADGTEAVLLNSKEHAVGYLSKILNAKVYEAAIETELQHAENLSKVS